ncbi:MAG: NAD-dependent epimerase/dehydratase family protein [Bacteroidota bacterium]
MQQQKISILGIGWLGGALAKQLLLDPQYLVLGSSRNEDRHKDMLEYYERVSEEGLQSSKSHPQQLASTLTPADIGGSSSHQEDQAVASRWQAFRIQVPDFTPRDDAFFQADVLVITLPPGRRRADVVTAYPQEIEAILSKAVAQRCKHIIYTSSTGVYGHAKGIVTEASPLAPQTESAKAVVKAEEAIMRSEVSATILRLAGLYGPMRHPGRWFAQKPQIPNGDAPVNLVHQSDVVTAIMAVIQQDAWGEIYNVCTHNHPPKGVFYAQATLSLGYPAPDSTPGGSDGKVVSAEKIQRALGWSPRPLVIP